MLSIRTLSLESVFLASNGTTYWIIAYTIILIEFSHILCCGFTVCFKLMTCMSSDTKMALPIKNYVVQSTLSKLDTSPNRTSNLVHLPNCTCTSVTELSLKWTVALVPRVSALERVDCTSLSLTKTPLLHTPARTGTINYILEFTGRTKQIDLNGHKANCSIQWCNQSTDLLSLFCKETLLFFNQTKQSWCLEDWVFR